MLTSQLLERAHETLAALDQEITTACGSARERTDEPRAAAAAADESGHHDEAKSQEDTPTESSSSSPIELLVRKMHELVRKYNGKDAIGDASDDLALLRDKVNDQELLLIKLTEQEVARQAETEHLRASVLSLQQDLMRLMNIVELQMQIPVQIPPPLMSDNMTLMRQGALGAQRDYHHRMLAHDMAKQEPFHADPASTTILNRRFMEGRKRDRQHSALGLHVKLLEATEPMVSPSPHEYSYSALMKESLSPQRKRVKTSKLGKRPWSVEEDQSLTVAVQTAGASDWSAISRILPGRCGKQCRERWVNHLSPSVTKEAWTEQEDDIIFKTREKIGNHWADIARLLPGRTDNAVKNRFYSTMRRRVRQQRNMSRQLQQNGAGASASVENAWNEAAAATSSPCGTNLSSPISSDEGSNSCSSTTTTPAHARDNDDGVLL